jgi:molybdenum cofactor cytidylyltransferase
MPGPSKLLREIDGEAIVTRAIRAALDAGVGPVVVVTATAADEVRAALPDEARDVRVDRAEEGMAASLRAGLAELPDGLDALFVALGDMPFVRPGDYRGLARVWTPGAIVVPTFEGRRGHPVLWSIEFAPELSRVTGDRGGRAILRTHAGAIREVPIDGDRVLLDIDDPEDLARARERGEA